MIHPYDLFTILYSAPVAYLPTKYGVRKSINYRVDAEQTNTMQTQIIVWWYPRSIGYVCHRDLHLYLYFIFKWCIHARKGHTLSGLFHLGTWVGGANRKFCWPLSPIFFHGRLLSFFYPPPPLLPSSPSCTFWLDLSPTFLFLVSILPPRDLTWYSPK